MYLKDWITLIIASAAFVLSFVSFYFSRKASMLNDDNNIIQYVSTLFVFLKNAQELDEKERELFKKLLEDARFFEPTTKKIIKDLAFKQWSVDKDLKEYFRSI